jgi:hypothetical protein
VCVDHMADAWCFYEYHNQGYYRKFLAASLLIVLIAILTVIFINTLPMIMTGTTVNIPQVILLPVLSTLVFSYYLLSNKKLIVILMMIPVPSGYYLLFTAESVKV